MSSGGFGRKDSNINIQPETDNPHNSDQVEDLGIRDYELEMKTREFDEVQTSVEGLYRYAARLSDALTDMYEDGGPFVMVEVDGQADIEPVFILDEYTLAIDEGYHHDKVEGKLSPLSLINEIDRIDEASFEGKNAVVSDLSEINYPELEREWGLSPDEMIENDFGGVYAAPGMQEKYREEIRNPSSIWR